MSTVANCNVQYSHPSEESKSEPYMKTITRMLDECNVIKYAAYRTAAKLRCLQKFFRMDHVRLGLIAGVFYRHQLQASENEVMLDSSELEAVLSDIFFAAQKETLQDIKTDVVTEQMVNLLLNIHNAKSAGMLQVISAKVTLVVLSSAKLQEKYQYYFHQLADHNNCISRKKIKLLLSNLVKITEFLNEAPSFGEALVSATVESCIEKSQGTLGVTEDGFIEWLRHDPQLLVWMSTLYRLQAAEVVYHGVKCAVCKMYPIGGLRYRCLRCLKYNQCQTCFFTGKLSKRHKLKHPMQEYCCETTSKEATVAFLRTLKNKLCRTPSKPLQYLPVPANTTAKNNEEGRQIFTYASMNGSDRDHLLDEMDLSSKTVLNGSRITLQLQPQKELQSIICNLEDENRHLQQEIAELCLKEEGGRVGACLMDHRAQIEAQVERLKLLKIYISQVHVPGPLSHQIHRPLRHMESTPIVPITPRKRYCGLPTVPDLDSISPITREEEKHASDVKRLHVLSWQMEKSDLAGNNVENELTTSSTVTTLPSLSERSVADLSTWLHKDDVEQSQESSSGLSLWLQNQHNPKPSLDELHGDLDDVIEKLQNMLTTNFSFEESFNSKDNAQLQKAATEMENLLAGLIDGVEQRKKLSNGSSLTDQKAWT
ncbi:dystrophin [Anabrus simplex]|uniref:dystrophin n=1 Tax=Anabrus simplex TaxID=316456 RepID=UPI0035A2A214